MLLCKGTVRVILLGKASAKAVLVLTDCWSPNAGCEIVDGTDSAGVKEEDTSQNEFGGELFESLQDW